MKNNCNTAKLLHWIAAPSARNDGGLANDRHCEGVKRPRQSSAKEYKNQHPAFSLIELLISLIIISLILSALSPVITRKIKSTIISHGAKTSIDCAKFDSSQDEKCLMCEKTGCLLCSTSTIEKEGYYVDPASSCSYQSCSDKFINCAKCNKDACLKCKDGYSFKDGKCEIMCSKIHDLACLDCDSEKCLKCKEGYILENNKCEIPDKTNFVRIGNLYVTRRNMGDSAVLTIPSEVNNTPAGTYCNANNQKCCWHGATSSNDCIINKSSYTSCPRTVCNYLAAKEICNKFNYLDKTWRLAKTEEMVTFTPNGVDVYGFGMCSINPTNNYDVCATVCTTTCKGANPIPNQCRENDHWADNQMACATNYSTVFHCGSSASAVSAALSVRCVTEAR